MVHLNRPERSDRGPGPKSPEVWNWTQHRHKNLDPTFNHELKQNRGTSLRDDSSPLGGLDSSTCLTPPCPSPTRSLSLSHPSSLSFASPFILSFSLALSRLPISVSLTLHPTPTPSSKQLDLLTRSHSVIHYLPNQLSFAWWKSPTYIAISLFSFSLLLKILHLVSCERCSSRSYRPTPPPLPPTTTTTPSSYPTYLLLCFCRQKDFRFYTILKSSIIALKQILFNNSSGIWEDPHYI